jgi:hypothetical protein
VFVVGVRAKGLAQQAGAMTEAAQRQLGVGRGTHQRQPAQQQAGATESAANGGASSWCAAVQAGSGCTQGGRWQPAPAGRQHCIRRRRCPKPLTESEAGTALVVVLVAS